GSGICLTLEVKVFSDDASVPGAARCCYEARDEKWKYSGKDQLLPTFPSAQPEDCSRLLKISGDRHSPGDHVEQDVPLRAEQKQNDGTDTKPSAQFDQN